MNYIDIAVILLAAIFIALSIVYAYSKGLQHGKQINQGIVPKVNINPVKAYTEAKEAKETKEEEKKLNAEIEDILSATKESMLENIKKGR